MKSHKERLEAQRTSVSINGDCTHLVQHAKTDQQRKDAEEMLRSGDPALAFIGLMMLGRCPNEVSTDGG